MTSFRPIGKLLLTGVPGWLTAAVLEDLARNPLPGLCGLRCLVEPSSPPLPPGEGWGEGKWSSSSNSAGQVRSQTPLSPTLSRRERETFPAPSTVATTPPLEIVRGDLRDSDALRAAVQGVDSILHAAGVVHVRRIRDWYDVNTGGTQALARAAQEAGVGRLVYISSNAAAGAARDFDHVLTEADPPAPRSHYGRSKWLAEQALAAMTPLETVVLRPACFTARRCRRGTSRSIGESSRDACRWSAGAISPAAFPTSTTWCRAAAWRWAIPRRRARTYYITDRPIYTTLEIVEAMAAALGVRPRYLRLPRAIGPMAFAANHALSALGLYWQTLHLVGESDWHVGVSCDKACRQLGYRPTMTLAGGMAQAVAWCVGQGLLTRKAA